MLWRDSLNWFGNNGGTRLGRWRRGRFSSRRLGEMGGAVFEIVETSTQACIFGSEGRGDGGTVVHLDAAAHEFGAEEEAEGGDERGEDAEGGRQQARFDGIADEEEAGERERQRAEPDRQAYADEAFPIEGLLGWWRCCGS